MDNDSIVESIKFLEKSYENDSTKHGKALNKLHKEFRRLFTKDTQNRKNDFR